LIGDNTDDYGFISYLRQFSYKKGRAVVLGAGGASRAIIAALKDDGFENVVIVNRTREKADILAERFDCKSADWENRNNILEETDLLVNTSSLGLEGKSQLDISLEKLPKSALVSDIVYSPLDTDLLLEAKKRGNVTVDGLGMLINQAIPGFEGWFGKRPEMDEATRNYIYGLVK
jgi:shikimate dehydrogenase